MRLLSLLLLFCSLVLSAAGQAVEEKQSFAIQLTIAEKYRDTLLWDARIKAAAEAHYLLLKKWEADGKLVLAGKTGLPPRAPELFELLVLQPMTLSEARALVMQNPAVKAGLMRSRLLPFEITAGRKTAE